MNGVVLKMSDVVLSRKGIRSAKNKSNKLLNNYLDRREGKCLIRS